MRKINILLLILILPFIVIAQDNQKMPEVSKTIDLTEVTVKADKIESKLQETPVAVSVIEVKKIEDENIVTLSDLSAKIPNLFVLDYGSKLSPPIFIRGMGLRRDVSPSVGLYVDNIPYLEKGSFNFDFVDVASIEVLRGPQGTLHGRNTMGGLIKIYTQEPKAKAMNYLKSEFGNYGHIKQSVHINQPLSSKFYTVFNYMFSHGDGFFTNEYTDRKADKYNTHAIRLKLAYRPNNDFKATLSVDYESSRQLGYPYAKYDVATKTAAAVNYNKESFYDRDQLSMGINVQYIANDFIFSSSSSYQLLDDTFFIDQDFSPTNLYFINQERKHHTIYQELNFYSKPESKIDWLFGAMYFKQFTDKGVTVTYGDPFITLIRLPFDTFHYLKTFDQPTSGLAIYGQATLPIWKFELTAGARMDVERAELDYTHTTYPNGNPTIQPGFNSNLSFEQFIPKFSLAFKPCDYFTSFFAITKGFKAGGFNSSFESDDARVYDPEKSWNYELGFKSSWFDKHLITNLSLYYIDIDDQQVLQPVPSGQGAYVRNAAKSTSKGIELEVNGYINENWQVWTSYGLSEAKFDKYTNQHGIDLSGKYIPNVPMYTFSIGSNYSFELNGNLIQKLHVNASYQHVGKQYWEETNTASQNDYGLTNLKLTFENEKFDLGIWAKNVFDVDYHAFYFTSMGISYVQLGKPMQFGAFLKFKFWNK